MTQNYDVVVAGGGIAGSIAAKLLAETGYDTLLLEACKTPRNKVCSGVQLPYMEKLVGKKIPKNKLCKNELNNIAITTPSGRRISGKFKLLNYWRSDFDDWLNSLAIDSGADFRNEEKLIDFRDNDRCLIVETSKEKIKTRFLIGADGLSPTSIVRRKLRPAEFSRKVTGTAINFYYKGTSELPKNSLELFYRRNFSDLMYSWLYYKDDLLVIGTSSKEDPLRSINEFYKYVHKRYSIKGEVVRKEGYTTSCLGGIFLGSGNVLLAGDAAGLLDLYRGTGMDSAAISGRIVAKSIIDSNEKTPIDVYHEKISKLVKQLKKNNKKQQLRYDNDEGLENSLKWDKILLAQAKMSYFTILNKFQPPEKMSLLPP
ncbi:NAD(P)/FAD-dependent oxidoreductase [Candidatus Bathyarchaeota archaeon]|nr:NAD(P)/FAD-dependent oxidoreductase [Candidatus Bathyarchaeota archaeon]